MKIIEPIDYLASIFFKYCNRFPFTINFIRHPFYDQVKGKYLKLTYKFHNDLQLVGVNINKNLKFKIYCKGNDGLTNMDIIMFRSYKYEQEIIDFILSNLSLDDTFIDIGANIGFFSLMAAAILNNNGQVHAFEPVSTTFTQMEKSVKVNSFNNINCYQKATGNEKKNLEININKESGHNSISFDRDHTQIKEEIQLDMIDNIIKAKNDNFFIKIDTEGYEYETFLGMENLLKTNKCKIVFEFTPSFYSKVDYIKSLKILDLLNSLGYELYEIDKAQQRKITTNESYVKEFSLDYYSSHKTQVNIYAHN